MGLEMGLGGEYATGLRKERFNIIWWIMIITLYLLYELQEL